MKTRFLAALLTLLGTLGCASSPAHHSGAVEGKLTVVFSGGPIRLRAIGPRNAPSAFVVDTNVTVRNVGLLPVELDQVSVVISEPGRKPQFGVVLDSSEIIAAGSKGTLAPRESVNLPIRFEAALELRGTSINAIAEATAEGVDEDGHDLTAVATTSVESDAERFP